MRECNAQYKLLFTCGGTQLGEGQFRSISDWDV